jgi:PAS domain S-box-containing protein
LSRPQSSKPVDETAPPAHPGPAGAGPGPREALRQILEGLPTALAVVDVARRSVYLNEPARRLFGPSFDPLTARSHPDAYEAGTDMPYPLDRLPIRTAMNGAIGVVDDLELRRSGGGTRLEVWGVPVRGQDGAVTFALGVFTDVTERKRAEDSLRFTQALIGEIAGCVSLDEALGLALRRLAARGGWSLGQAWVPDATGTLLECTKVWPPDDPRLGDFHRASAAMKLAKGQALPGAVWASGGPAWIDDVRADPSFRRASGADAVGLAAAAAVPVMAGDEVVAVLEFLVEDPRPKDAEFLDLVSVVSPQLGWMIRSKRIEGVLRRRNRELEGLYRTTLGLVDRLDVDQLLRDIVARAAELVGTEHGYLYTLERSSNDMVCVVGIGKMGGDWLGARIKRGQGVAGRAWDAGQTVAVDDYRTWPGRRTMFDRINLRAVAGTPLRLGNQIVGVIGVARFEEGKPFRTEELELLERFGELASLVLYNASLYEQERAAAKELRRLDDVKNTLLRAVSHELQTPLAGIQVAAKVLVRELEADEPRHPREKKVELVRRLEESARGANRLLGDLLDLDRVTRGIAEPDLRPTELAELVRRVVGDMPDLERRPVHLELEPVEARVDVSKVERILQNLLSNADKYSPPDAPIWVTLRPKGQGVLLGVDDAGTGVPDELRDTIFDPFVRGGRDGSSGLGIGLSLVARFAELHGGRAWVQDRPDGGAAFRVFLPTGLRVEGPG